MSVTPEQLHDLSAEFLLAQTTPGQRKELLLACAKTNDVTGLQRLLTAEPALLKRAGEDAVAQACIYGHLAVVERLHRLGARINGFLFDDSNPAVTISQYPLYCAVDNGKWDVAQWLIANGASLKELGYQPRLLANSVNKSPSIFRALLQTHPYIAAFEKAKAEQTGANEKGLSDGVWTSLEVIAYNEFAEYAQILIDEGLAPAHVYEAAMKKHSYAVLRDLYVAGYRPDKVQLITHYALIESEEREVERAAGVRSLLDAWVHKDNHINPDADQLARYRAALHQDPCVVLDGVPVVMHLTRSGCFKSDVAPLLASPAGSALMQLTDQHGATLSDVLVVRGELAEAFAPAIWRGDFMAATALYRSLPGNIQTHVDMSALSAAFGRYRMGAGTARFKLGKGGGL